MKYFFTADYHLGHKNIIKYCNRPFKTLDEMNKTIVRNHNQRVKSDDIVFHIGDFCFKNSSEIKGEGIRIKALEWEKRLNGKIIHIKGNHDRNNSCKTLLESAIIKYGGELIYLVHRPEHFNSNYDINFVGHVHNIWKFKRIKTQFTYVDL